jgi:AcrR family transcriptional regulator
MSRPHKEEERKEATIRAVWAALVRYGVGGTTIEKVSALGGFSRGVVHYYFASKRELLLAAFEAYLSSYDAEIQARLQRLGREPDAAAVLDAVIESALPPFDPGDLEAAELPLLGPGESLPPKYKSRLFVQFFSIAMGDRDFASVFKRSYERQCAAMAGCYAAISPEASKTEAMAAAAGLAAIIDGFSLHRVLGFIPAGLPEHVELAKLFSASVLPAKRSDT